MKQLSDPIKIFKCETCGRTFIYNISEAVTRVRYNNYGLRLTELVIVCPKCNTPFIERIGAE